MRLYRKKEVLLIADRSVRKALRGKTELGIASRNSLSKKYFLRPIRSLMFDSLHSVKTDPRNELYPSLHRY